MIQIQMEYRTREEHKDDLRRFMAGKVPMYTKYCDPAYVPKIPVSLGFTDAIIEHPDWFMTMYVNKIERYSLQKPFEYQRIQGAERLGLLMAEV